MNTKITLLLLLVLLVILLLFYYVDLESNIIILLGVTIVILVHHLITKKEHFNNIEKAAELDSKIDVLLTVANALKTRTTGDTTSDSGTVQGLSFDYSCPVDLSTTYSNVAEAGDATATYVDKGIDIGIGSSFEGISADSLLNSVTNAGTQ